MTGPDDTGRVESSREFFMFCMFWPHNFANFFRNFTFEIIDYFKCCSNGSSLPHLNQMLEFLLNRPTTSMYVYIFIISSTLILAADWSISLVYWTVLQY